jgi:acyl dehydratase
MGGQELIGKEYPPFIAAVEKGRIRQFAKAIGETDPIYFDETAAKAAGFRSLPVPPTFPFSLAMDADQPLLVLNDLGVDKTKTVHGEQSFAYHGDICAGDVITGRQRVVDIYEKKGGTLRFIVTTTRMDNQAAEHVCDLRSVIVVRAG